VIRYFCACIAAVVLGLCAFAQAATIVLDMEDLPAGYVQPQNQFSQGFRLSPRCHFDIATDGRENVSGQWLGFDEGGCDNPRYTNPNYFGREIPGIGAALVFVDRAGEKFDFLAFAHAGDTLRVISSAGATVTLRSTTDGRFETFKLPGDGWREISWVAFVGGRGGAPTTPIDNLTFDVDAAPAGAPAAFSALLLGLGVLRLRRGAGRALKSAA
jgi:hypothetical protein